ncbi:NAD-dependent epimerase/dehydratase family protein [Sphingobacterium sp. UT-1RO-CII-1]|uniref:NAD-dependent epimerase/dehydratase family protein n=1 Tax=Sphingobacterium sp. UT-1RO-CII-1 TaxID=2995225 RepID=UPI00227B347E|nr:NAD-dependent epimerase/dehydratase family protein [Sphingobacterium sp. UT-1RO-CII-1]MCY4781012.1 NAD-dependent epimerase/dehydratase family protein [Sphingobacterium sp. UT-1RO-CII-1]
MILVTGGTGFLGARLIKLLIDDGVALIATKRESSIIPASLKSSSLIQWINADITDYFTLADLFPGITEVYHCAALVSYQKADKVKMLHTNIEGTKHLVNLCIEYNARLIHVSSIAALGVSKKNELVDENSKWDSGLKHSNYSISKYESEMEVWRGVAEGLNAVIINPSLIMGSGTEGKGSGAIFNVIKKGLNFYPLGSVGIVDVEDVAKISIILMNNTEIRGERFILNSENVSHKKLTEQIAILLNKKPPTTKVSPFMLNVAWRFAKISSFFTGETPALTKETVQAASSRLAYSNEKITNKINYTFKPVEQTLTEMSINFK